MGYQNKAGALCQGAAPAVLLAVSPPAGQGRLRFGMVRATGNTCRPADGPIRIHKGQVLPSRIVFGPGVHLGRK